MNRALTVGINVSKYERRTICSGIRPCSRPNAKITLVVRLGREGTRLPPPSLYRAPAPLRAAKPVPQIALDARFASTPAKIRAALAAFSQDLFRDTFITK